MRLEIPGLAAVRSCEEKAVVARARQGRQDEWVWDVWDALEGTSKYEYGVERVE